MPKQGNKSNRIDPTSLGIPSSSMDPVETVRMEGNFYREIATRDYRRKWPIRLMGILVGLFFMGSSIFAFLSGLNNGLWGFVPLLLAMLFLFVGARMIWANIY
jgi:hypothetical protein